MSCNDSQAPIQHGLDRDRPRTPVVLRLRRDDVTWDLVPCSPGEPSAHPAGLVPGASLTLVRTDERARLAQKAVRPGFVPELVEAVAFAPEMTWVQPMVGRVDAPDDLRLAGYDRGLAALRWDSGGLSWLTPTGPDVTWSVRLEPARLGCPVRYGDPRRCRPVGGPFGSAAIEAFGVWDRARHQLVDALGCEVCHGAQHEFRLNEDKPLAER